MLCNHYQGGAPAAAVKRLHLCPRPAGALPARQGDADTDSLHRRFPSNMWQPAGSRYRLQQEEVDG